MGYIFTKSPDPKVYAGGSTGKAFSISGTGMGFRSTGGFVGAIGRYIDSSGNGRTHMKRQFKFEKNVDRDMKILAASIEGGEDAVMAAAMFFPDFDGGPDAVHAYGRWISGEDMQEYRAEVAQKLIETMR